MRTIGSIAVVAALALSAVLPGTAVADEDPLRGLPLAMTLDQDPDQDQEKKPQDPDAEKPKQEKPDQEDPDKKPAPEKTEQDPETAPTPRPELQEPEGAPGNDLLDFDRLEGNPRIGMLFYSDKFEADPAFSIGGMLRAPSPWVSRDIFGLDEDLIGGWFDLTISTIDRDLDFLQDKKGVLIIAGAGADFTFHEDEDLLFRAQAGIQYGYMGGVDELDDGVALALGVLGGVQIAEGVQVTLNPQIAFADAGNRIIFLHLGVNLAF